MEVEIKYESGLGDINNSRTYAMSVNRAPARLSVTCLARFCGCHEQRNSALPMTAMACLRAQAARGQKKKKRRRRSWRGRGGGRERERNVTAKEIGGGERGVGRGGDGGEGPASSAAATATMFLGTMLTRL